MKKTILLALGLLISMFATAQSSLATKIRNEGVVEATVTVDGKTIEGYIKKVPTWSRDSFSYSPYWEQQELIKFIDKKTFASYPKLRATLYTEYTPKTCDGFVYDGIEFKAMKYSDAAGVTSVVSKKLFLRKVGGNDKVTFFIHYRKGFNTSPVDDLKDIMANPDMAFSIGDSDKAKSVEAFNARKDINCPKVVEKLSANGYPSTMTPEDEARITGFSGTFSHTESVTSQQLSILEDVMNGLCD